MSDYKQIYVRGYRRKGGIWVSPHIRTIKISGYGNVRVVRSYKSINPLQLCMDFTGKTTTYENS